MNTVEINQLQAIRDYIAKNAERGSQNEFVEKWVIETAQRLDALLDNARTSQNDLDTRSYGTGYDAGFMAGKESADRVRDLLGE